MRSRASFSDGGVGLHATNFPLEKPFPMGRLRSAGLQDRRSQGPTAETGAAQGLGVFFPRALHGVASCSLWVAGQPAQSEPQNWLRGLPHCSSGAFAAIAWPPRSLSWPTSAQLMPAVSALHSQQGWALRADAGLRRGSVGELSDRAGAAEPGTAPLSF